MDILVNGRFYIIYYLIIWNLVHVWKVVYL